MITLYVHLWMTDSVLRESYSVIDQRMVKDVIDISMMKMKWLAALHVLTRILEMEMTERIRRLQRVRLGSDSIRIYIRDARKDEFVSKDMDVLITKLDSEKKLSTH